MKVEVDEKRIAGVIVGREVTAGRFSIEDAALLVGSVGTRRGPWTAEDLRAALDLYRNALSSAGVEDHERVDRAAQFVEFLERGGLDQRSG